jgi:hypothetical protein
MMAAISRNFDLDQSSNVLARTTHEFPKSRDSSPFGGSPNRYHRTGD